MSTNLSYSPSLPFVPFFVPFFRFLQFSPSFLHLLFFLLLLPFSFFFVEILEKIFDAAMLVERMPGLHPGSRDEDRERKRGREVKRGGLLLRIVGLKGSRRLVVK